MSNRPILKRVYKCYNCKDKNFLVECLCGCKGVITKRDKYGKLRRFILDHYINTVDYKGFNNPNYKNGRTLRDEYWYVLVPDYYDADQHGTVREHVYFYEQYHKCCMLPWGEVHHIDGSKDNNMPWNLMGVTHSQHLSIHNPEIDMSDRRCSNSNCKKPYETYIKKIGRPQWYYNTEIIGEYLCSRCNRNRSRLNNCK